MIQSNRNEERCRKPRCRGVLGVHSLSSSLLELRGTSNAECGFKIKETGGRSQNPEFRTKEIIKDFI